MLPMLKFNETEILAFALILLRISAFIVSWPVFSVYSVPNSMKILFSVALTMILFPVINRTGLTSQLLSFDIAWLALKEILTGLCIGFLTRLFFFACSIGGNLIATSVGLANGQIFNPSLNMQTTVVEQFYVSVATLLFLAINGHHVFISGLVQSFDFIPLAPVGTEIASTSLLQGTMPGASSGSVGVLAGVGETGMVFQSVVEAGIKISAPVLVSIFFMNVALGIVGRAVPQMNVLVTSMSVNFMAGILVMIVSIPALILEMDRQMVEFADVLFRFLKSF